MHTVAERFPDQDAYLIGEIAEGDGIELC